MIPYTFVLLFLVASGIYVHTLGEDDENDDEYITFESDHPYTQSVETTVECAPGYNVLVIIEELSLDLDDSDYLLIKAGAKHNDNRQGLVFVAELKSIRRYVIGSDKAYFQFNVRGTNVNRLYGFKLKHKCDGAPLTTTPEPSTTIDLPQSITTDNNFTGYVYTIERNIIDDLRLAIKGMANAYCITQNIDLEEDVDVKNVLIDRIDKCPINWPEEVNCFKIKFAVPVKLASPTTYQLTEEHLEIMWTRLGDEYLNRYDMEIYKFVHKSDASKWIVTAAIVFLMLTILLVLAKFVANKIRVKFGEMQFGKEQSKQITVEEKRNSDNLLHPHPYQVIPVARTGSYFEVNMRRDAD